MENEGERDEKGGKKNKGKKREADGNRMAKEGKEDKKDEKGGRGKKVGNNSKKRYIGWKKRGKKGERVKT